MSGGAERVGCGVASSSPCGQRARAESFARRLATRLRSLAGAKDGWPPAQDHWSSDLSSSSDNEVFFDADSPATSLSPECQSPLQRSDSSASTCSQFYDTVEEFSAKPLPLLRLRTEPPVTNGHPLVLDADLGCSRVRVISEDKLNERSAEKSVPDGAENRLYDESRCVLDDRIVESGAENGLDERIAGENAGTENRLHGGDLRLEFENLLIPEKGGGNSIHAQDERIPDNFSVPNCVENGLDGDSRYVLDDRILEKDAVPDNVESEHDSNREFSESSTAPYDFGDDEIQCLRSDDEGDAEALPPSDDEECSASPMCVFCDIEQIKSSLAGEKASDPIQENGLESSEGDGKEDTVEENIPLSDLLLVLKEEISAENGQRASTEVEGNAVPSAPIIEVDPAEDERILQDGDEEFDIEAKRKNFRRCSSLKSGKTPPGTPGRKKIVRFADVLGLDLADVKTFLDEVPNVPRSAFEDLSGAEAPPPVEVLGRITVLTAPPPPKLLRPLFQQPCIRPNFLDRVRSQNVCLENAMVSDPALAAVTGLVRVRNLDFHKSVYVRYTIDGWRSFADLQARYVPHSSDGFSDKFSFTLYAHTLSVGQSLQFAIRFQAAGEQYWDSNDGNNYRFECVPGAPPPPDPGPPMDLGSFY